MSELLRWYPQLPLGDTKQLNPTYCTKTAYLNCMTVNLLCFKLITRASLNACRKKSKQRGDKKKNKADVHHHSPAATAASTPGYKKGEPRWLYNLYLQTVWWQAGIKIRSPCGLNSTRFTLFGPLHSLSAAAVWTKTNEKKQSSSSLISHPVSDLLIFHPKLQWKILASLIIKKKPKTIQISRKKTHLFSLLFADSCKNAGF